ncbi:MAG: replicative DNA helicase, partial [Bacilli bacterium]
MAGRVMPNNLDAEESVLGACFLSKNALDKVCEVLCEEAFYSSSHGKIFRVLKEFCDEKIPVDLTTVTSRLKNYNYLDEVGGVNYLTELINFVPTAANIDYYIKIVEDCHLLRKLIDTATDIVTSGYETNENVNEVIDLAEQKILSIIKDRRSTEFRSIQDVLRKTQSDLEKLSEAKGEITGLATGFSDLDRITAGFHENEFIIVAARPAMGKTAFALNIATHIGMNYDKAVALFNLEMGAEQLAQRMIASQGQVEGFKLRTGSLLNNDWKRVNEAISQLSHANIYMDDTPGISIGEIRAKCRRLASTEKGLGIVIIDYLQLISGG